MVIIFVASLKENVKLAKRVEEQLNSFNIETKTVNLVELELPMYDTNKHEKDGIPKKAQELAQLMDGAEGYVFVAPEYNFGITPVLVNMIAWVSRIGDDYRKRFNLRKVLLATHSGASGQDFLNAFRMQLSRLNAIVNPREIVTTYSKEIEDDSLKRVVEQYTNLLK